jgi:hypothetical protein
MDLAPATALSGTTTLSPFDAGPVQPWVIWRRIAIEDGAAVDCGARPSFDNLCEDEFVVQSITDISP